MTLQQMRYCLALARWKSFSKAAESLFITQPALSKQIALLEASLGIKLFERTVHGAVLTAHGQEFCERIRPLVQELDQVWKDMAVSARLTIGALPSLASYYLPELIAQKELSRPETVVKDTSAELLEAVLTGEVDAALVQDVDGDGKLEHAFLLEEPYLLVVPDAHPFAQLAEVAFSDLAGEKIILHQSPCDIRHALLQTFAAHGIEPDIVLEASFNESLLGFTATGLGLSFVPRMLAEHVTHRGIVYKPLTGAPFTRKIYLYTRSLKKTPLL
ncbi:hypothetical protein CBW65_14905 [Tumebacillus avium]|uniref:HTH lysR-type domain-containing protein n=1 Tax=Tumebacillus avium TaxID=1903704 RepID=A0A1Y0IRR4_9BACL|nr:LysR family transcriptional regulator [Tumebacillus avium]ARU62145.1 hypothetical protein CBW65_14905 [Tumebacillus avium]